MMLDIADLIPLMYQGITSEDNKKNVTENEKYLRSINKHKRRKIEEEEEKIRKLNHTTVPIRYKILESSLPPEVKAVVMRKVEQYEDSDSDSSGYHKLKVYMDKLLRVPFGVYYDLPVKLDDNLSNVSAYINNIQTCLNTCIYGQVGAKTRLLEVAAKWITNPISKGNIIGLYGPAGVGKTTLIKKGLCKALDAPFAFVPLGGCSNASILEGHDYTYEGSKNGKLVDILIEQKCMNPIIFFDELDKLGEIAGREISGVLTHLTDHTQNDTISDRYFSDFSFDFSKCLFIFSFNDITKINPILRDRISVIEMKGFSRSEKCHIAEHFSIPKYVKEIGLDGVSFKFKDKVIEYIVDTYCSNEQGIRKLEQCVEAILMKINIYRLTNDKTYIDGAEISPEGVIGIGRQTVSHVLNKIFNMDHGSKLMMQMMYN